MSNCVIRISADSTCDLSPQLLEQYGIETLPLYVIYDGVEYKDGVDLTPDQLYEKVRQGGKLGSTAAINVDDYLGFFSRLRESCDTVIHFTISSEMSSCYQNACIAAQEVGGVYPVDSRNLSTGIGLLVLRAAEMVEGLPPRQDIFGRLPSLYQRGYPDGILKKVKANEVGTVLRGQRKMSGTWKNVQYAFGFKQQILLDGRPLFDNAFQEAYGDTKYGSWNAWTEDVQYATYGSNRTAIGFKENGEPVIITEAGRDYEARRGYETSRN